MATVQSQETQQQWKCKASAKLHNISARQAWSFLHHFKGTQKPLHGVEKCHLLEGTEGVPGSVRYRASACIPTVDGSPTAWSKEKLLAVDHEGLSFTYEMVENNAGCGRYVTETKVVPEGSGEGGVGKGCRIEWSFCGDPIKAWTLDGLASFMDSSVHALAKSIEDECGVVNA